MIITEIHHNSAGKPVRYQVEAGHDTANYKLTVSKPSKIRVPWTDGTANFDTKIEWINCEYWTYEDILRIQKLLPIVVDRIKEFYDDHERLVANAEWMSEDD